MTENVEQLARHCLQYRKSDTRQAVFQLFNTFVPFLLLCVAMYQSMKISYALALLLAVPTAGLVVRIFIIQHDCGHGSFFKNNTANDWTGRILSLFTITPYNYWRRLHALHHASSSNLDKRGYGDIDTLTVREYQARGFWGRLGYRIYRNPFFLMFIGGPLHFLLLQRLPLAFEKPSLSMWMSVMGLNLAMLIFYGGLIAYIGTVEFFMIALPVALFSSAAGIWLFYIQHQFEDTHWAKESEWDRKSAALYGSSYYQLPKLLQWFTGNIGIHHVHHLCSAIPNYRLQECLDEKPQLQQINKLTIRESLAYANLSLWDEDLKKLISFKTLRHAQG